MPVPEELEHLVKDIPHLGELLEVTEQFMEMTTEIAVAMVLCTCAAHRQLAHHDCIIKTIGEDSKEWMKKRIRLLLSGSLDQDEYFRETVMWAEKQTVKRLEEHVPGFVGPQR